MRSSSFTILLIALLLVVILLALMIIIGLTIMLNTGTPTQEGDLGPLMQFVHSLENLLNTFIAGVQDWIAYFIEKLEDISKAI
ncbi:hypothetical protein J2741_000570 [Methanolinea mesophila]|uniref:hypothetical protein n=1 Tax=Methanolinea mesophila TaxID=547055 RepID=UPI001AE94BD4|nr:hypothetical protein [Methanolinea mesophila]MBP1928023.1 hypothetical protein [Methanolinea mesophila]